MPQSLLLTLSYRFEHPIPKNKMFWIMSHKKRTLIGKITVSIFKQYFSNTVCYLVCSISAQKILQLKSCVLSTHYNTPLVLFTPHSSFKLKKICQRKPPGTSMMLWTLLIRTDNTQMKFSALTVHDYGPSTIVPNLESTKWSK